MRRISEIERRLSPFLYPLLLSGAANGCHLILRLLTIPSQPAKARERRPIINVNGDAEAVIEMIQIWIMLHATQSILLTLSFCKNLIFLSLMPKPDQSQEALRQVEKITGSKPVRGETLLRSRKLKRQLAEAKKRMKSSRHLPAPVSKTK